MCSEPQNPVFAALFFFVQQLIILYNNNRAHISPLFLKRIWDDKMDGPS